MENKLSYLIYYQLLDQQPSEGLNPETIYDKVSKTIHIIKLLTNESKLCGIPERHIMAEIAVSGHNYKNVEAYNSKYIAKNYDKDTKDLLEQEKLEIINDNLRYAKLTYAKDSKKYP